jgi:uncharacterized protein YdaU (DUF1376 family)
MEARLNSPSFPCYVNNILGSGKIAAMNNAEFGAYWLLLCRAWNEDDCGLPDDDEILAAWSRCNGAWPDVKKKVMRCFFKRDGRWFNERLLRCRAEKDAYKQTCSQAGKIGASRRWGGHSHPIARP